MRITKKLNNNAAQATDGSGNELIVFGKGVGFPAMPYELTDLSLIQRTFYDVNSKFLPLINEIPEPLLFAVADVVESSREVLDGPLNPNLLFTLADHLNYAIQRVRGGIELHTPFAYDVRMLYPKEYSVGCSALKAVENATGIVLPECEAVSVALHLINAEMEGNSMHSTMVAMEIISHITGITEEALGAPLDHSGFNYARFTTHLRYLVQRIEEGRPTKPLDDDGIMYRDLVKRYPKLYQCMLSITKYFSEKWDWQCSQDERLYLMLHLIRVSSDR